MEKEILETYSKGVSTIEDLHLLNNDKKLSSSIDQLHYYLTDLRTSAVKSQFSLNSFKSLSNLLCETIRKITEVNFLRCDNVTTISIQRNFEAVSTNIWDKLLTYYPLVCKLSSFMPFEGEVVIRFNSDGVSIKGTVSDSINIEKVRPVAYKLTKKILKDEGFFTYNLVEGNAQVVMELNLKFLTDPSSRLCFDFVQNFNLFLTLDGMLETFLISPDTVKDLPRHLCVEIGEDLKVNKYYRIPDKYSRSFEGKEILYFSFLFRPISIIIPRRGMLLTTASLQRLIDTGCESNLLVQEGTKSYHFDIFSLLLD